MRFLKTRIFAVIIALFLVLPAAGFAAENDELLARLASLLQQVQALQAQISAVEGGAAPGPFTGSYAPIGTATVTGTGASGACITLTANLRRGETGSEVTRLQEFLAKDRNVYPEAVVSGYYGELTERAVQRWQSLNGVVTEGTPESTGYGVVGPKTRVALQTRCSVQPNYNDAIARELIVTPIAGAVPLEVTATFSLNGSSCSSYQLDWGDGTAPIQFDARLTVEAGTVLACTKDIAHKRATHVYTRAGTHQITLRAVQGPLAEARVVKRISVSVGTTVASNFSIYPTSGPAPLTTAITFPVYGSNCTSYEADWGDGGMDRFQPSAFTLCNTETGTESLLHTYLRPGLYNVRFKTGNKPLAQLPLMEQWNVVASEGAVAGAAVAVTPTSGSAPLTVRVAMGGRAEACTSYQLDWGDGT
ncbi:MAG: peptidoglycan-binding protein, partial [bacterium]|nr:peptidoglycan-binding protein [bacterium]